MSKYLVKFSGCYADEFDIDEAAIINSLELAVIKQYLAVEQIKAAQEFDKRIGYDYQEKQLRSWFDNFRFCYCFGTNEEFEYEGLYGMMEIWLSLKITPITDEEIAIVKKFDLVSNYGFVNTLLEAAAEYDFEIHKVEGEE